MRGIVKTAVQKPSTTITVGTSTSSGSNPLGSAQGTQPGGSPLGVTVTGTILPDGSTSTYNFTQPYGIELGVVVGAKMDFETMQDPATGATVAIDLRPVEKGIIQTINAPVNGIVTGTLQQVSSTNILQFVEVYNPQSGLAQGIKVSFETIVDPNTAQTVAVSLNVV